VILVVLIMIIFLIIGRFFSQKRKEIWCFLFDDWQELVSVKLNSKDDISLLDYLRRKKCHLFKSENII
jgi:hypothetical protein